MKCSTCSRSASTEDARKSFALLNCHVEGQYEAIFPKVSDGATYVLEVVSRNVKERVAALGFHAVDVAREPSVLGDL